MKCLYIDCGMGAAGDMLNAAMYELLDEKQRAAYLEKMNALELEGVTVQAETVARCGIQGTHMAVRVHGEEEVSEDAHDHEHAHDHVHEHEHDHHHDHGHHHDHEHHHDHDHHEHGHHHHDHEHEHDHHEHEHHHHHDHHHDHDHHHHDHDHDHHHHDHDHDHHHHDHNHDHHHHDHHHHASMRDVSEIITALPVSDSIKKHTLAVYNLIAEAEAHAHGVPVTDIHFHEVGTKDAVADVAGVCLLLEMIAPDEIVASPVHVGSGKVRCAHGILPVPAPATAHILTGVPVYGGEIQGELCTPTGAALLKHFVNRFEAMPKMTVEKTGYGMGKKEFKGVANCLRVMCGEAFEAGDFVIELVTNADDMTPEETGFAMEMLFEAGALEVYTQSVYMKKNRPGLLINVMCREADKERVLRALFKHTTTIGVREYKSIRHVLERKTETIETENGPVRKKTSAGYGAVHAKYEYDDLAKIAREKDLSLREARGIAEAAEKQF